MKLIETAYNLEHKFDYFNDLFFDNELNPVPLSFEKLSKGSAGVCHFDKVDGEWKVSFIALSNNTLEQSEKYIDSVLIHEMIHYWVNISGQDTNQHHNKAFKDKVDEINHDSHNQYKVGYTDVSMTINDEDDLEIKEVYIMVCLYSKSLTPTNLVKAVQVFTEENYNPEYLDYLVEQLHVKNTADIKVVYIIKANINNNFISEKWLESTMNKFYGGFHGFPTDSDKLFIKLLKQSKDYEIIGAYDWRSSTFTKV